ncbi:MULTISPECIES: hypothetical protein [Reichenbachiella]|uniref:Uncharacterized protein n=1 Tax=Reichenbachiella agariperforans TaxID=156994 RepID=A0A1M6UNC6_REIAG|nr:MULTISPECIES: hypothetical protein [Reichenbachiella]RJE72442.1 hypothetical protein BGP76_00180 [Reichenbachiella sp. MSK19-1]SHK70714.1 hypothetical protein SAMN04488028_107202 [Reichenbachiella agariperforans]
MEQEKKSNSFFRILISAGLLSFILGVFSLWVNTNEKRKLDQKQFQNGLIEQAMTLQGRERSTYINTLFKCGVIDSAYKDSLVKYTGYWKGYQAARAENGFLGSIEEFFKQKGRIPYTIQELDGTITIQSTIKLFDNNIYYYPYDSNKQFQLRFPGADEILMTSDDGHYRFNRGETSVWNKVDLKWERWKKPKGESMK